jgi:pimeloyl-ACP methyl ester carboxylesterase
MPLIPAATPATPGPHSGTLVLLLHAYTHTAASMAAVQTATMSAWPGATVVCPTLPAALWSTANPNEVVAGLLSMMDQAIQAADAAGRPYERVVLVGHSLGALLARKLYVVACGETADAPFESEFRGVGVAALHGLVEPRPWAGRISRLVLLAGMNRGWRVTHHLSLLRAPMWAAGVGVGNVVYQLSGRRLLILTIRRGAEFVTQLRIQWLRMRQRCRGPAAAHLAGGALTVQLLGSRDDMVAPEDNVDLVSGGDFHYLDVPYSGHADVIELDDPAAGPERRRLFLLALSSTAAALSAESAVPSDEQFSAPDPDVKKMLFVVHGIRDAGYWTHKIARRVKKKAGAALGTWATETSSYGYFPMLPFLFPWYRRNKVEWLMDQYTEALARYPNAQFSYVGHSNGTYLVARALELYPCCRFENIVFAGSVVSRHYDWGSLTLPSARRVHAVLNFVASSDLVVAAFPKLFQMLKWQDLGSAGHDGFALASRGAHVHELAFIRGGHGAAIDENLWDTIADFVLTGRAEPTATPNRVARQSALARAVGRYPYLVWGVIAALFWGLWLLVQYGLAALIDDTTRRAFATGFGAALYVLLLWLLVTRV